MSSAEFTRVNTIREAALQFAFTVASGTVTEAILWDSAPRYVIRNRDSVYGDLVRARIKAMGLEEVVTAPRSPRQNPFVERMIGSIGWECLDHLIVIDERHRRCILASYFNYYHRSRTHLSLGKDSSVPPAGRERESRQDHRPPTGWRTPPSLRATGRLNADLTTADNNHIAPLAGSVPVAGKRGDVGSGRDRIPARSCHAQQQAYP